MKKVTSIIAAITLLYAVSGCQKANDPSSGSSQNPDNGMSARPSHGHEYQQVNLVSDTVGFGAGRTDSILNNPWGIAFSSTGVLWIACNHTGSTVIYDQNGVQLRAPVSIPFGGSRNGSSANGVIFNNTTDFAIPSTGKATHFIYAAEDGILSAWSSGDTTITVADRSATGAVYKGLALGSDNGANFLYVTNFNAGTIDVYDKSFNLVSKPFSDPSMPSGFAPFNIANIDGKLYVTYAMQDGAKHDDVAGPGNGYVDIFKMDGSFIKRFASQGTLNSPWGITETNDDFGQGEDRILIGNFGDGRISVYDESGKFKRQLMAGGQTLSIQGLWTITFAPKIAGSRGPESNKLFFTAGPDGESHGILGYIKKN